MTPDLWLNPTPAQLASAVDGNLFDLFRATTTLPGAELHETPALSRHHASPTNPMFKGVWATRLTPDSVEDAITDSIQYFKTRQAPFFFWWTGPDTEPTDMGERLLARGFAAWEQNAPGMTAKLSDLDYDALQGVPPGFVIERVTSVEQLDQFVQAFNAGLEVPEWAGQAWREATLALGVGRTPWVQYVGKLNGEPVACNMLFNGAGVASVYGVATLPSVRRQGIGAAITLIAYQDAMKMGYQYGVLFATDLGAPVYRRIGFKDCGVGISRYLWRNV